MLDIDFIIGSFKIVKDIYPWLFYLFYVAIAASVGSFLGCCFYRIPKRISLLNPKKSFCPNCKAELAFWDLIPILSYIFLRAKCRHCHAKIAPTYFIIEVLTVVGFLLLIW